MHASRAAAGVVQVALVLILGMVGPAAAQVRPPVRLAQLKQKQKQLKQQMQPLPGPAVERFLKMSPAERERALAQLPPERRDQMEQNLARLEKLTPEDRARLDRRFQIFNSLPAGRKALMREAIMRLRAMTPAQRKAVLESDDAKLRYNPDEIRLLRDVVGLPEVEE